MFIRGEVLFRSPVRVPASVFSSARNAADLNA